MTRRFEELYLEWLYAQVYTEGNSYWGLMHLLYEKEFVWIIANDDNRIADGLDLRVEFMHSMGNPLEHDLRMGRGCSALEVLIGLSRRLSFLAEGDPAHWAWRLLENLGLREMLDPLSVEDKEQVDHILETLIWRNYGADGSGGFFPLAWPEADQRRIELWYQMNAYVEELYQP